MGDTAGDVGGILGSVVKGAGTGSVAGPWGTLAGAVVGLGSGIAGMISKHKANRELEALKAQDPHYGINPVAVERLSFAKALLNARMPGASQMERNIFANQANQMGNIAQNATDSSQMLALGAASQGQTNNALQNLNLQEAQDYQRRYGNLQAAQEGMINEGDKLHKDKVRNFEDAVAIKGAQAENRTQAWNSLSQAGFGMMNFGLAGGWDNIMKGFGNRANSMGGPQIQMNPMQTQLGDASMNANFYQGN